MKCAGNLCGLPGLFNLDIYRSEEDSILSVSFSLAVRLYSSPIGILNVFNKPGDFRYPWSNLHLTDQGFVKDQKLKEKNNNVFCAEASEKLFKFAHVLE